MIRSPQEVPPAMRRGSRLALRLGRPDAHRLFPDNPQSNRRADEVVREKPPAKHRRAQSGQCANLIVDLSFLKPRSRRHLLRRQALWKSLASVSEEALPANRQNVSARFHITDSQVIRKQSQN